MSREPIAINTKKILLIILDGVGIGELPDAPDYDDRGSNTLGNTARAVGGLTLPHLASLGLGNISPLSGVPGATQALASYGRMAEVSKGKDSTTGHWELTGIITEKEFPTFPHGFPSSLMLSFLKLTGCEGYLGNTTASGTIIIRDLGEEHLKTGFPIVYTSADSVFQIAAHEEVIPPPRLYEICRKTRDEVCIGDVAVSRVIARPFVGSPGKFTRTANRRDFSLAPPKKTLLDLLTEAGLKTVGVGKIDDLFAHRGLSTSFHTTTNAEGVDAIVREGHALDSGMLMANLGDFDTLYGHRNDPHGFARALVEFDRDLPRIIETIGPGDLLLITADHGNDPVTPSTDHSREYVPLLVVSKKKMPGVDSGTRSTFADVGKTIAEYFGVQNTLAGAEFSLRTEVGMDNGPTVIEFEGTLDEEGRIALPRAALAEFRKGRGRIRVRLMKPTVSSDLEKKGVSDDEIDRIAVVQHESPEQVITFLLSQGTLRKHKRFRARIGTYGRRTAG